MQKILNLMEENIFFITATKSKKYTQIVTIHTTLFITHTILISKLQTGN